MSAKLLTWAYRQKTGSCITKAVLIKLVDNANDLGYAHPSMAILLADLELSERAARTHLKKLEDIGVLKVIREKVAEKVNLPNRYQLLINATSSLGKTENCTPPAPDAVPPSTECTTVGHEVQQGVMHEVHRIPSSSLPQESPQGIPSTAVAAIDGPSEIDLAVEAYNRAAENCPKWTCCRQMTTQRRKTIGARLAKVGLQGWIRAVDIAAASAFLGGPKPTTGDHAGWTLDIAWFSKEENFAKILEGRYRPGGAPALNSREASRQGLLEGIEEALR